MQPPGYCDAPKLLDPGRFDSALESYLGTIITTSGQFNGDLTGADLRSLVPAQPTIDWRQCVLRIIPDMDKLGLPPLGISLLRRVALVRETEVFRRQLARLDSQVRNAWQKTKRLLAADLTLNGLDFKPFGPPGQYSVRVSHRYRAHLRGLPKEEALEALEIGGHREMGHG
jgi:hypothetical protein